MKRILAIAIAASLLAGCAKPMTICGGTYDSYGLLNQEDANPNLEYKVILGNVIWAVLLMETVVGPVYFFGFSIKQPVGIKNPEAFKCVKDGRV